MSSEVTALQPLPGDWMIPPAGTETVNRGLEWLKELDTIIAHMQDEWVEGGVFDEYYNNKRYAIRNTKGKFIYYSVEDSGCCVRYWLGSWRPFGMKIVNNYNIEVIHLWRPFRCDYCFFPCSLQEIQISSPKPEEIKYGSIEQVWNGPTPRFRVKNAQGEQVYWIQGPFWTNGCCNDPQFKILNMDETIQIGKITKDWHDMVKEAFRDEDKRFGLCFPQDLESSMKATLLGALFLIDFMYFESNETDSY